MTEENAAKSMVDTALEVQRLAALSPTEYDRERSKVAKTLGIRAGTLDDQVEALRKKRAKEAPKDTAPPIDADKAKLAAGDLVACPDILERFGTAITKAGLVGETNNAKILFLALISRRLKRPVSVAVKGVSSGGKSFTVESVLKFFPPSAYFSRTGWSEKAAYFSEEDFRHRFIVLYEAAGAEGDTQSYIMRTLLSEGRLSYEIAVKTEEGIKAQVLEKEGPTGLITTTTAAKLHPENETRLLSLGVIDTQDQTKKVMQTIATNPAHAMDYAPWWALQEWLTTGEQDIAVPFAYFLAENIPPIAVRLRRDFGALLSLIRAHALLHRESRQDEQGQIVATVADYTAVYHLVEKLFAEGIEAGVPKVVRQTVEAVREYLARADAPAITLTQLAKELKLDKNSVHHRVKKAITAGYLLNQEERKGRPARIVPDEPLPEELSLLPDPEIVAHAPLHILPPEITPTLQHPQKPSDGTKDLAVGDTSPTASNTPTVALDRWRAVGEPPPTVKPLLAKEFHPTVGVLEPNPDLVHRGIRTPDYGTDCGTPNDYDAVMEERAEQREPSERACTACGQGGGGLLLPHGFYGELYHSVCWRDRPIRPDRRPAAGPEGDSIDDL